MACRNAPINLFFLLEKAEEKVVHNRYPILIGEYGNIISLFLIKSWCTSRKNLLPVYLDARKCNYGKSGSFSVQVAPTEVVR